MARIAGLGLFVVAALLAFGVLGFWFEPATNARILAQETTAQDAVAADETTLEPAAATEVPPTATPTDTPIPPPPTDTPTTVPTEPAPTDVPTEVPTDVPPTEAPTEPPPTETPEPTVAPTETESPSEEDGDVGAAQEEPTVGIDCSYNIGTNLTTFEVHISKLTEDAPDTDPELIVVARALDNNLALVPPITYNDYESGDRFADQPWRVLRVNVTWPDGSTGEAIAGCNTSQNQTTVSTQPMDANGDPIPDDGQIPLNEAMRDTAELSGQTVTAAGTATYNLYFNEDCSGTPVFTETVEVVEGQIPPSSLTVPTEPGLYNWQVEYSGDTLNTPSTSLCGSERVIVGQVTPTVTTEMTNADTGQTLPDNASIAVDTAVQDQGFLSGASDTAGGNLTYNLYDNEDCTGSPVASSTVPVEDGVAGPSDPVTLTAPGTYNWQAVYSGDLANAPAESDCGTETLIVVRNQPVITTIMTNTDTGSEVADGATIPVETPIEDQAVIDEATDDAGGTVTYFLYADADCTTPIFESGPHDVSGGVVPPSDEFNFPDTGVYNWQAEYSGDERNEPAESVCGTETLTVIKRAPTVTTEMFKLPEDTSYPDETFFEDPTAVYDTGTLDGASSTAGGTVRYQLYNNFNCTGDPVYDSGELPVTDGVLPDSGETDVLTGGTYNWLVTYSGDERNEAFTTRCGDEQFFIVSGSGNIATTMRVDGSVVGDDSDVGIFSSITDSVTFTGFTPDASGELTYNLYPNNECTDPPVFTQTVTVTNASAPTSTPPYQFIEFGTYQWQVEYTGDDKNDPFLTPCGAETVIVGPRVTTTSTVMRDAATDATIGDDAGILVGTTVYDTASIANVSFNFTGTITYRIWTNANCSGEPVFTSGPLDIVDQVVPPSGEFTLAEPVIYNWRAAYSGDVNNQPSESSCGSETIFGQVQPTITTSPQTADGTTIPNGGEVDFTQGVRDTATLDGQSPTAGGTVTFNLYEGTSCTGTPAFSSTVPVTGGVVAPSDVFTLIYAGSYTWQAVYSGDQHNLPTTSTCGDETFVTTGAPVVETTMLRGGTVIPDDGTIVIGDAITDSATLRGITRDAGGTMTYNLYANETCTGAPLFSSAVPVTNGSVPQSDPFTFDTLGTYNWQAVYSGDANNDGSASACGTETLIASAGDDRSIAVTCDYFASDDTTSFRVLVSPLTLGDPNTDPNLTVVLTPFDRVTVSQLPVITYNDYDSLSQFERQPWRRIKVDVTWPDGIKGTAFAGCSTATNDPSATTTMLDANGNPLAQDSTVPPGSQVGDSVTFFGATADVSGTVTYNLFANSDCSGEPIFTDEQVITNGVAPPSSLTTVTEPGVHNWLVTYSGDSSNEPAETTCGDERFFVAPAPPTITTGVQRQDGTSVPDGGSVPVDTVINDTATLQNVTADAGGTATYNLYNTADCTGEPIFTDTVDVTDGVIPPSDPVQVTVGGTLNWQVSYSGDDNNAPVTSACGAETVVVTKFTPAIVTDLSTDEAATGDLVHDSATLTGATADASGTVTYFVFTTSDCSGEPIYTLGPVTVTNGVVPDSPDQLFPDAGNFQWQAVYSGDERNEPATSPCGSEPLVVLEPSLVIEKEADTAFVSAGQPLGFTITVTNTGEGIARDVTLSDPLPQPDSLDWVIDPAATSPGCAITPDGASVACSPRDLGPGEELTVHVTTPTDEADCRVLLNTAEYDSTNAGSGSSGRTIGIIACSDVIVEKVADELVVNAGEPIGFTITVSNIRLGTAFDVTLTDVLPTNDGLDWTIDQNPDGLACDLAGGNLVCDIGDMPALSSVSLHLTSPTLPVSCGVAVNVATSGSVGGGVAAASTDGVDDNTDTAMVTINCPDLEFTKVPDASPVESGGEVGFTLSVTNVGDGTATNVIFSDILPAGIAWTIDGPDGDDCRLTSETGLFCEFGDLEPGESRTVHVSGTTDRLDCGVLTNVASAAAENEAASDTANNSGTATITVLCPNLTIEKSPDGAEVSATDPATFQIVVTNTGPGVAFDVQVEDTLPPGEWTVTTTTGTCESPATGQFSCDLGDLAAGEDATITVSRPTTPDDCGTLTNAASASATNNPEISDDGGIVVECPNLSITKGGVSPISAGQNASFTVTVTNAGPGAAYDVTLTDPLPAGVDWSVTGTTGVAAGCAVTGPLDSEVLGCGPVDLAAGESFTVTVSGATDAADCGTLTNIASVTGSNTASPDPIVTPPTQIRVFCPHPLQIKRALPSSVSAGEDAVYAIAVLNPGPGTAFAVTLTDPLPAGLDWVVGGVSSINGGPVPVCTVTGGALTCSPVDLAAGRGFTVTLRAPTTSDDCGEYTNTALLQTGNDASADPVESNPAPLFVNCSDVTIEKVPDADPVDAGDPIGFTITVVNTGQGDAFDVTLTDILPTNDGLSWTVDSITPIPAGTGPTVTCQPPTTTLTCGPVDLAPGEGFAVHLVSPTTPESCGLVTNVARIELETGEQAGAAGTLTVDCPSLVVGKFAPVRLIDAGETAVFAIGALNNGPGLAKGVTLSDPLPAGPDWRIFAVVPTGGAPDPGCTLGTTLECGPVDLDSGQGFVVILAGPTDGADCGLLTNTATGSAGNEAATDPAPNSDSASILVRCPRVVVEKTAGPSPISAGEDATYTITVSNRGLPATGTATDVVLTDDLPAGIAWTAVVTPISGGPTPTCDTSTGELVCTAVDLDPGEGFTVTLTGPTDAADCAVLPNVAGVQVGNDPTTEPVTSESVAVTVECPNLSVAKTAADSPISAGENASFSVTVSNAGPGTAFDVTLSDPLPAGVDWEIAGTGGVNAVCAITGEVGSEVLSCGPVDLAPGGGGTIVLTGETDAVDCGTLTNQATVDASNDDAITSEIASITVRCPNLTMAKTAADSPISAGETASFTVSVANAGLGVAFDVTVNDPLPAGIDWAITGTTGVPANCAITDRIVSDVLTCGPTDLPTATGFSVTVSGLTNQADCGIVRNTATFDASNLPDEVGPAQVDESATLIVLCPDLELEKTAVDGQVIAGDEIAYTLTVTSNGPGTAFDVVLEDELPAGIEWTESPDTPECEIVDQVLNCAIGTMASGESFSVTVTGETDVEDCGRIRNFGSVSASNEPLAAIVNNIASDDVNVNCPDPDPEPGEVLIQKFFCPTSGDAGVIFEVTTPRSVGIEQSPGSCTLGPGVPFTITGPNLPDPLPITTGPDGTASAILDQGPYVITEDSTGASTPFTVESDTTIVISVYNLEPEAVGSVVITKYWCPEGSDVTAGIVLLPPDAIDEDLGNCALGDAQFQIDNLTPFLVGGDGEETLVVPIGEHTIVETCTDESADFTLSEGEELDITVVNVLGGDCDPPPAQLPNTGAGVSTANDWQEWLAILLLIAGGIAMLGAVASNRRSTRLIG